jgi:hypothetical protein
LRASRSNRDEHRFAIAADFSTDELRRVMLLAHSEDFPEWAGEHRHKTKEVMPLAYPAPRLRAPQ